MTENNSEDPCQYCEGKDMRNALADALESGRYEEQPAVKGGEKVGHCGGEKVYQQRSLPSVNVHASFSGEVSQRQAGRMRYGTMNWHAEAAPPADRHTMTAPLPSLLVVSHLRNSNCRQATPRTPEPYFTAFSILIIRLTD